MPDEIPVMKIRFPARLTPDSASSAVDCALNFSVMISLFPVSVISGTETAGNVDHTAGHVASSRPCEETRKG